MAITKQSITGIPGITGPPVPARIALILVGLILNGNAIAIAVDGTQTPWVTFVLVYFVSMAIPHAIARKHRSVVGATFL